MWFAWLAFVFMFLVALGFFILGIFFFRKSRYALQMARKSVTWPTVVGTIVSSEITEDASGEGTTYGNKLAYEYSVEGAKYRGHRREWIGDDITTSWRGQAEGIAASYPVGRAVTVYYDSSDPAQALLEPRLIRGALIVMAFSLFVMAFLIAALPRAGATLVN